MLLGVAREEDSVQPDPSLASLQVLVVATKGFCFSLSSPVYFPNICCLGVVLMATRNSKLH